MAASTQDRNTDRRSGEELALPVAAATKIFAGIMVALNAAGYLVAASDAAALRLVGRSDEQVDNTGGGNGDVICRVRRGTFLWDNSGTSAVVQADLFKRVYVEDDHTVAHGTVNNINAGRFISFGEDGADPTQCWVETPLAHGLGFAPVATVDASDLATSEALANALKAKLNTLA